MTVPLELYPFKYFDPVRKRWAKARYRATREEIAARYPQGWEITGAPEIREGKVEDTFTGNFGASPIGADGEPRG